jgi:hypothetical protein
MMCEVVVAACEPSWTVDTSTCDETGDTEEEGGRGGAGMVVVAASAATAIAYFKNL